MTRLSTARLMSPASQRLTRDGGALVLGNSRRPVSAKLWGGIAGAAIILVALSQIPLQLADPPSRLDDQTVGSEPPRLVEPSRKIVDEKPTAEVPPALQLREPHQTNAISPLSAVTDASPLSSRPEVFRPRAEMDRQMWWNVRPDVGGPPPVDASLGAVDPERFVSPSISDKTGATPSPMQVPVSPERTILQARPDEDSIVPRSRQKATAASSVAKPKVRRAPSRAAKREQGRGSSQPDRQTQGPRFSLPQSLLPPN